MLTSITITELNYILKNTPSDENIMLVGKHGIGKSEIVKTFFERQGKHVETVFCSQAADPGDIIGLPRYNKETNRTEFAPPYWFPTDNTPIVLFLDELNRARPEILQVVMDLTLNRKISNYKLPDGSQIISAINDGDEYQLTTLDPALVSRFNVYQLQPTVREWIEWAETHNLNQKVISFITINNNFLDPIISEDYSIIEKSPDRRAWKRVSDILNAGYKLSINFKRMLSGIIGGSAAATFYEYLKSDDVNITVEKILTEFSSVESYLHKAQYKVQEYTRLIDNICSYINTHVEVDGDLVNDDILLQYGENLLSFLNFLCKDNREAMSYFITNYEAGTYPNLNMLIISYFPKLDTVINNFIISNKINS